MSLVVVLMYFPNEGLTPAEYRADTRPPTATHAEFQHNMDINRLTNSIRTYSFIWLVRSNSSHSVLLWWSMGEQWGS